MNDEYNLNLTITEIGIPIQTTSRANTILIVFVDGRVIPCPPQQQ
jgi:hypothetical protein